MFLLTIILYVAMTQCVRIRRATGRIECLFNGLQNGIVAQTKQTLLASIISPGELILLIIEFEGGT